MLSLFFCSELFLFSVWLGRWLQARTRTRRARRTSRWSLRASTRGATRRRSTRTLRAPPTPPTSSSSSTPSPTSSSKTTSKTAASFEFLARFCLFFVFVFLVPVSHSNLDWFFSLSLFPLRAKHIKADYYSVFLVFLLDEVIENRIPPPPSLSTCRASHFYLKNIFAFFCFFLVRVNLPVASLFLFICVFFFAFLYFFFHLYFLKYCVGSGRLRRSTTDGRGVAIQDVISSNRHTEFRRTDSPSGSFFFFTKKAKKTNKQTKQKRRFQRSPETPSFLPFFFQICYRGFYLLCVFFVFAAAAALGRALHWGFT